MPRVTFFKDRRFAKDRILLAKTLVAGTVLLVGVVVFLFFQDQVLGLRDKSKESKSIEYGTVKARPSALWDQSPQKEMGALGAMDVPREALAENARITKSSRMIEAGEFAKALLAAETAATLAPSDPAAWHHAGAVAMACGETEKAREYFRKALAISPFAPATLFNLAQLEFDAGDYHESARLLAFFRKQDPRHRIAAYRAVVCTLMQGQTATLEPEALPEDSTAGLYARAAIATRGGDEQGAMVFVGKARAMGSRSASRFEADLRLLGFKE